MCSCVFSHKGRPVTYVPHQPPRRVRLYPTSVPHGHPSPPTSEPPGWASSSASSQPCPGPTLRPWGVDCTFGASVLHITPGKLVLSLSIRSVEPVNLSIAALAAKNANTTTAWSWASQEGCLSYHTFPRHQWSVLGGTTFQRETPFTV